jgi:hypothetical protein
MKTIEEIRKKIKNNMYEIAKKGNWDSSIDVESSLLRRVPTKELLASGFDAGIAAALDLIPKDSQKLVCTLHASYSEECINQIRKEVENISLNSEACWWLAACSIRVDGKVNINEFLQQISDFSLLQDDPILRRDVAIEMMQKMKGAYHLVDKIPFAIKRYGMQGAYLDGYRLAVQYEPNSGNFFIGTYEKSLNLEDFKWNLVFDKNNKSLNGPVFGSKQYVKTYSFEELGHLITHLNSHFL